MTAAAPRGPRSGNLDEPVSREHPAVADVSQDSDAAALLCVGLYPYDVVHLLAVAREARGRLGLEPVFLDVAAPEVSAEVVALVTAAGFRTFSTTIEDDGGDASNWLDQLRRRRRATRRRMDEVLDEIRPAAILAGVNPQPGFFLDHAAARGIPTVVVQLFHWGDRAFYRELHADDRRHEEIGLSRVRRAKRAVKQRARSRYGFGPYIAWDVAGATIAAQGPAMARRLREERAAAREVVVTGNPGLDELYALRGSIDQAAVRLRGALGVPAGRRIVTQMRSHEGRLVSVSAADLRATQAQIVQALRRAAPDAQVVIKVHPKEDPAEQAFIRALDPEVLVVGDEVDSNELLAASAVVVGTLSTTLLHAVLLDLPTVSAWLWPGLEYFRDSTAWSGVERVTTVEALTDAVRRHLDDPGHRQAWAERRHAFVADEFAFDGAGTERLLQLLGRLTRDRSPVGTATPR